MDDDKPDGCPDWCEGDHDDMAAHASDWDGVTTDEDASVLVRTESDEDGTEYVRVATTGEDTTEVLVRLTLDQAEDLVTALRGRIG